jgi:hypothetical protein
VVGEPPTLDLRGRPAVRPLRLRGATNDASWPRWPPLDTRLSPCDWPTLDIGGQASGRWPRPSPATLGINPFDQPNVEAAKIKAREIVPSTPRRAACLLAVRRLEPGALGAPAGGQAGRPCRHPTHPGYTGGRRRAAIAAPAIPAHRPATTALG